MSAEPKKAAEPRRPLISDAAVEQILTQMQQRAGAAGNRPRTDDWSPFRMESRDGSRLFFPPKAMPPDKKLRMAFDDALQQSSGWATQAWMAGGMLSNVASEGLLFMGYPLLSELAQRPEYRLFGEIRAEEMTRKWTKFRGTDDESVHEKDKPAQRNDDDSDRARQRRGADEKPRTDGRNKDIEAKIKELQDFEGELQVRAWFKDAFAQDQFFGISHLYLDLRGTDIDNLRDPELATDIGNGRDKVSREKLKKAKGILRGLRTIEPMWCYPTTYNATNPLQKTWYDPQVWYVMGAQTHKSRLLSFVGRPVPDILKPAYAFGGLSTTQMAQPYVDIWLKTRAAVGELIHAFSVMVLMTQLGTTTMAGGAGGNGDVLGRAELFKLFRDNMGLFVVDKATEDFKNISAPISGLDELQAQSQEHMFSVGRIPAVKFTGIQPKGLNATSEGEMRAFNDTIHSAQEHFRARLTTVYDLMQISLWGERDPDITFDFEPLHETTEKEKAELRKTDAETDQIRIDSGLVSQEEARTKIANDPESGYDGIDPDDLPDLLGEEEQGLIPEGSGKGLEAELQEAEGAPEGKDRGGGNDAALPFVGGRDAFEWLETDHPRGQGGKFSSGSGAGGGFKAPQLGLPYGPAKPYAASSAPAAAKRSNIGAPLDVSKLKKVGGQKGSNPGGVYEDAAGKKFYVKQGKSPAHVRNEMIAAALYDLAGSPTLQYRPVEGGKHIATEMVKLDKDNAGKLSPEERSEAAREFAVHAWLGNWDAVGLGGDNIGTVKGTPAALDLGGALEYRAQGAPKGAAFGEKVGELQTLRDAKVNKDAAAIFGDMTPNEMRESARFVTGIPDEKIRGVVEKMGGGQDLADKLVARKKNIAGAARYFGAEGDPNKPGSSVVFPAGAPLPVKALNGVTFAEWEPPADWASVDGQADIDEPELVVPQGKEAASGLVIREKDGRVWIVQPKGGYGGYEATFPKGRAENGLSLQANAIKEAWEESGLKARVVGHLADREGDVTMTRYYVAEREGGDPAKHDPEAEGVVLAPPSKLDGFLNRERDQSIAAQLASDEASFEESKHPRKNDGKFAPKGGGEGGASAAFKTKKDHAAHLLQKGVSAEEMKAAMGWGSISFPPMAKKLGLKLEKYTENGVTKYKGTPLGPEEAKAVSAPAVKPEPPPAPKPAAAAFPPPTEGELAKAKKSVALQLQYVPTAANIQTPAGKAEAQKLVDTFNDKYANKEMTSQPALIQKVNDFKIMNEQIGKIAVAEVAKAGEWAKQQAEQQKQAAVEAAAKAKAVLEEAKQKNKAVMEAFGISDAEAEGFNQLVSMMGGKQADVIAAFKGWEAKAKEVGYTEITGFQYALIRNYIDGGYVGINSALRSGSWKPAQHVYARMVNNALDKLPKYTGVVTRGANLTADQIAKYQPGLVTQEHSFTSTGIGFKFGGNVSYTIKANGKRGADFSKGANKNEKEVLFKAGTFFLVHKVEQKNGITHIEMEEVEGHG